MLPAAALRASRRRVAMYHVVHIYIYIYIYAPEGAVPMTTLWIVYVCYA